MSSKEQPSSSPLSVASNGVESLSYYKAQYEQLEADLAEFQTSSKELESELERDVEASEKRERQLQEKVESLGYEVEEWKVGDDLQRIHSTGLEGQKADITFHIRLNTNNPRPSRIRPKTPSRRRLQPFAIPTGLLQ